MKILRELGFRERWIYEVIVLTQNGRHATPVGVWTEDYARLNMDLYKGARTLSNLLREGEFTLGLTDDIRIFHRALKGKSVLPREFGTTLNLVVSGAKDSGDRTRVIASVKSHKVKGKQILLNRAAALALECLIASTKPDTTDDELMEHLRVIKKVAPGSDYEKLVAELVQ